MKASRCSRTTQNRRPALRPFKLMKLLIDPQEDTLAAYLAGRHPSRTVPGQGRPGDQIRIFRIGCVQPGEPGECPYFPQPLGLHDVGEEASQRGPNAGWVATHREVVGRLGGTGEVKTSHSGVRRSGYSPISWSGSSVQCFAMLRDGVKHFFLGPLMEGLELGQVPQQVEELEGQSPSANAPRAARPLPAARWLPPGGRRARTGSGRTTG